MSFVRKDWRECSEIASSRDAPTLSWQLAQGNPNHKGVISMVGLQKGMSMNFIQAIVYRRCGKLLLMLGLFAVLSLAFTTFHPDQVLEADIQVLEADINEGHTITIDCSGFGKGSVITIYCGDSSWQPAP
jgi:hypothetical protein